MITMRDIDLNRTGRRIITIERWLRSTGADLERETSPSKRYQLLQDMIQLTKLREIALKEEEEEERRPCD
jgi:hypothetical protein